MQDIEKNRVEYVARMEEQVMHLKRQLDEYKPLADKWTPVVATVNEGETLRITVCFGGKRVTVGLPNASLLENDATSLTSTVTDAVLKNLVADYIAAAIRPEIEKAKFTVGKVANAGKW
jgi:hypothetical protein